MGLEKQDKWKNFLLAFLLTLALLSCVMVAAVAAVQPGMPQGNDSASAPLSETPLFRPQAGDSLTMAVIGGEGTDFLLIRFNPQYGQVPLSILPPETLVTLDGERMTLSQAFAQGGGRAVKKGLSERLGIKVDRYARLTNDAFLRVAEKIGTVVYTLPMEIVYTNQKGYAISIPAGERRLDGKDVADLFAYPGWADGLERSRMLSGLVAAIVNQNLNAASEALSPALFRLAVNLVDTDVTSADYEYRREAADFVAELETQVAGSFPADGVYLNDGASFELSESYAALIRQYFQATA